MSVVDSIQKAREKNISDDLILEEIRKQNPEKEVFFEKAQERGATTTDILNEIVKQNSSEKPLPEQKLPETPPPITPPSLGKDPHAGGEGKTLLTQEAQKREEEMRNQFLKRVAAKERGENIEGNNFFSSENQGSVESSSEEMIGDITQSPRGVKPPKTLIIVVGLLLLGAFILLALNFF